MSVGPAAAEVKGGEGAGAPWLLFLKLSHILCEDYGLEYRMLEQLVLKWFYDFYSLFCSTVK